MFKTILSAIFLLALSAGATTGFAQSTELNSFKITSMSWSFLPQKLRIDGIKQTEQGNQPEFIEGSDVVIENFPGCDQACKGTLRLDGQNNLNILIVDQRIQKVVFFKPIGSADAQGKISLAPQVAIRAEINKSNIIERVFGYHIPSLDQEEKLVILRFELSPQDYSDRKF